MLGRAPKWRLALALLSAPAAAFGQGAPVDQNAVAPAGVASPPPKPYRWHDSTFLWNQRVGAQTVGVGTDYQTRDPFYDWIFYARPRFYFWENDRTSLSLRGQLWASFELTNSDTTTRRGELMLEDTLVSLSGEHAFVKEGEYLTDLTLSLPRVELPTSKAGFRVGRIAQVGARAIFVQAFPLREGEALFPRGTVWARLGYAYEFTSSTVPEASDLNQFRMVAGDTSVSNDQIGGGALAEHIFILHGLLGADIWRDVFAFQVEFGIDPFIKRRLRDVLLCGVVLTGCVRPETVNDPQRLQVATTLDAYFEFRSWGGALKTALGYENITGQLGDDGERRTALYSPYAKFYLKFEFQPDLLLQKPATATATGTPRHDVAAR